MAYASLLRGAAVRAAIRLQASALAALIMLNAV